MNEITTDREALVLALALAIEAPDDDKAQQVVEHAEALAAGLDHETVEECKQKALVLSRFREAIRIVQSFVKETETRRRRVLLYHAWSHDLINLESGSDPYSDDVSDARIDQLWAQYENVASGDAFEEPGHELSSEEYEDLDILEGQSNAYERVATILQLLAVGQTPEQGKEEVS